MNDLSCVVDNHPRFLLEAIVWATCCRKYLPRSAYAVRIYFVDNWPEELVSHFRSLDIDCVRSSSLLSSARHCNKIIPFLAEESSDEDGYTIVTDTDVYIVRDVDELLTSRRVRAAPNNHCQPPLRLFEAIGREAGLTNLARPGVSLFSGPGGQRETHINNPSGGMVCIPSAARRGIAQRWLHWAQWLSDRSDLLQRWSIHVDQVALCLAMEEAGEDIEFLPPQCNAVLELLAKVSHVYAFHITPGHVPQYRRAFRSNKTLKPAYFGDRLNASMAKLNEAIVEAVETARRFEETRDFLPHFHDSSWRRDKDRAGPVGGRR